MALIPKNPYAIYIYCDGAMDYSQSNPGGIGFIITFPDEVTLGPIQESHGTYFGGNIEQLELEALIRAIRRVYAIFDEYSIQLENVNRVIFVTDRFGLREDGKTSPYLIKQWRANKWRNYEGKPIKNHRLLDELDKERKRLSARARVSIEYRPRKLNKQADKLAKAGKYGGIPIHKLQKKGEKIGRRKFEGAEMVYTSFKPKVELIINIFRKDPVQNEWEVWCEIFEGEFIGRKFKLYADDILAKKLQRQNQYKVKIKTVARHHLRIYRTVKRIKHNSSSATLEEE